MVRGALRRVRVAQLHAGRGGPLVRGGPFIPGKWSILDWKIVHFRLENCPF